MIYYPELKDDKYTGLRKRLLENKGDKVQRAFLEAAKKTEIFCPIWMSK